MGYGHQPGEQVRGGSEERFSGEQDFIDVDLVSFLWVLFFFHIWRVCPPERRYIYIYICT